MAAKTLRDTTAGVGKKAAASAGRATKAATGAGSTIQKKTQQAIPASPLQQSVQNLTATLAARAASGLSGTVSKTADRLNQYAEDGGGNLLSAITGVEKLSQGATPLQAAMSAGMDRLKHSVRDNFETVKESMTGGKGKGAARSANRPISSSSSISAFRSTSPMTSGPSSPNFRSSPRRSSRSSRSPTRNSPGPARCSGQGGLGNPRSSSRCLSSESSGVLQAPRATSTAR